MTGLQLAMLAQRAAEAEPPTLVLWVVQGGLITLLSTVFGILHRAAERANGRAVAAEQRRADDWRVAAERASARADERDRQLWTVLSAVKSPAGAS